MANNNPEWASRKERQESRRDVASTVLKHNLLLNCRSVLATEHHLKAGVQPPPPKPYFFNCQCTQ
jgi:hypothetical protein